LRNIIKKNTNKVVDKKNNHAYYKIITNEQLLICSMVNINNIKIS